jgi:hypothetical protein
MDGRLLLGIEREALKIKSPAPDFAVVTVQAKAILEGVKGSFSGRDSEGAGGKNREQCED